MHVLYWAGVGFVALILLAVAVVIVVAVILGIKEMRAKHNLKMQQLQNGVHSEQDA